MLRRNRRITAVIVIILALLMVLRVPGCRSGWLARLASPAGWLSGLFSHDNWFSRMFGLGGGPGSTALPHPSIPIPVTLPKPAPNPAPAPRPSRPSGTKLPKPTPAPKPVTTLPVPITSTPTFVTPPIKPGNLHPELIPRNITIVRCYYDQDVVNPGTTFDFDIDGSGFTEDFYEMISVDFDAIDIQASDLRLVTANQIRGRIHVGPDATTQYVYPSVLIRNLPVFKADDAFGVVRSGEVLDIDLTQIDETGQNGRFRVITNLDQNLYRMFKVDPTTPRLEVSGLATRLPFYVEGTITIAPGLHNGQYGLIASLAGHELFRKNPLVDVVHPNVGRAGSIERVTATEAAHRPGDEVQMTMTGSGFAATDVANLTAKLESVSTEPAQFSFLTAGKMTIAMRLPPTIPTGVYGITVYNKQKQVYNRKAVFAVVPANWIAGVHLLHPVIPGQSGILQITGRDLSPVYVQTLRIATDEPGLSLSGLHLQDASTIVANVQVSTGTAPGDYLIHLTSQDKPVRMPTGNIIRVGS